MTRFLSTVRSVLESRVAMVIVAGTLWIEVIRAYLDAANRRVVNDGAWLTVWHFDQMFAAEPYLDGVWYLVVCPVVILFNFARK